MDITLHIIAKPADHPLEGVKAASRYRAGDIIDIYHATKYATLNVDGNYYFNDVLTSGRSVFIHIKNVPDTLDKKVIKQKLLANVLVLGMTLRRRRWHIPPSLLPATFKQALFDDKEITAEFATVKAYIRKKLINTNLDPNQDDISLSIVDGDLE